MKKKKKKSIIWSRGNCYSLLLYTKTHVSLLESALLDVCRGERHRLRCCWRRVTSVIPCHSHWARMSFFRTLQASVIPLETSLPPWVHFFFCRLCVHADWDNLTRQMECSPPNLSDLCRPHLEESTLGKGRPANQSCRRRLTNHPSIKTSRRIFFFSSSTASRADRGYILKQRVTTAPAAFCANPFLLKPLWTHKSSRSSSVVHYSLQQLFLTVFSARTSTCIPGRLKMI